jgi:hypothetical protein
MKFVLSGKYAQLSNSSNRMLQAAEPWLNPALGVGEVAAVLIVRHNWRVSLKS